MYSETELLINLVFLEMRLTRKKYSERIMTTAYNVAQPSQEIADAIQMMRGAQQALPDNSNTQIEYTPTSAKHLPFEQINYAPFYKKPFASYLSAWKSNRRDTTKFVPAKKMDVMVMPPGLYGFTYLGESYMAINQNLVGDFKYEVEVHESIHTPDEYETRVLTWWMLDETAMDFHLIDYRPPKLNY